jgi:hypothetical protein
MRQGAARARPRLGPRAQHDVAAAQRGGRRGNTAGEASGIGTAHARGCGHDGKAHPRLQRANDAASGGTVRSGGDGRRPTLREICKGERQLVRA